MTCTGYFFLIIPEMYSRADATEILATDDFIRDVSICFDETGILS